MWLNYLNVSYEHSINHPNKFIIYLLL